MPDATPHEIAIQAVAELGRGLDIAELELRKARFSDARRTIQQTRTMLEMLDETIPHLTDREATDATT